MKYVILVYGNPASRRIWESFSDEEKAGGYQYYAALDAELAASGELIVSEALADQSLAKRVSVTDGEVMTTDGPMAEVKELVAGFYLIDCENIERAIAIAARMPEAELGLIEVRPVLAYDETQM